MGSNSLFEFEPTLSPLFAMYIRNYLLDHDVDPQVVFAECGLSIERGGDAAKPLSVMNVVQLFDAASRHTRNDFPGLRMGQHYHFESPGILISTILAAPSVEEAIWTLHHYDRFVDSAIETTFCTENDLAIFSTTVADSPGYSVHHLNEYLLTFIVNTLNKTTRKPVPLREVSFEHHRDKNFAPLEQFFGLRPRFSQPVNRICFDRSYLQEQFFTSNKLLYQILTDAMKNYFSSSSEKFSLINAVAREILREIGPGSPTIGRVAHNMALSARTLRRRLADEGYNFQQVKNMAREQRAKHCLSRTSMPLSEIALELGFSELSSFSRAFRLWAGMSPQQYRENS